MTGALGPEAIAKARRACTCCHERRRIEIRGVWVCTRCDGSVNWGSLNEKG